MNQIIQIQNNSISCIGNQINEKNNIKSSKKFLNFYFIFSSLIVLSFSFYYFYRLSNISKSEKLSQTLINSYNVSRLYSTVQNTSSSNLNSQNNSSVIGILQIDKINLKYPILSNINDYLLQIAPCRFYGPLPNEVRKFMHCFSQL